MLQAESLRVNVWEGRDLASCLNTTIYQGSFRSLSYALLTGDDTFFFLMNGDEPGSPCVPSALEQQVDLCEKSLVRKQICLGGLMSIGLSNVLGWQHL